MTMQRGFTLLEMTIVLIIVGLITGGILMGRNLLNTVQLKSVAAEYGQYKNAVDQFIDKYYALPGDMPNAVEFWARADTGAYTGDCATPATDTSNTGTRTCNGDGDGTIDDADHEMFRFWEHLQNAEMIDGNYSGVSGGAGTDHVPGTNSPVSDYSGGTWGARYINNVGSGAEFWVNYKNYLTFGDPAAADGWPDAGILLVEEAYEFDLKFDDGKPGRGKIITAGRYDSCSAAANGNDLDVDYDLTITGRACSLAFVDAIQ